LNSPLRRKKIRNGLEIFFFTKNFSIGVKWGEKTMEGSVFGFDHHITRSGKKKVEKMQKVTAFRRGLKIKQSLKIFFI